MLALTASCPCDDAPLLLLVAQPLLVEGLTPFSIAAAYFAGAAAHPNEPGCEIALRYGGFGTRHVVPATREPQPLWAA